MATVLLIHGIPGSARDWSGVADRLTARHRVVAPDLLGFGARSDAGGDLWTQSQADALAGALEGSDDVVLVGHDFGGPVALSLLERLRGRVRGLVLAASNVFPDTPVPFPLSLVTLPGMPRVLFSGPALKLMLRGHPDPSAAVGPAPQQEAIRRIFTLALRELPERYDEVEHQLRNGGVPMRVIWGEHDPFFSLAQARRTAVAAKAPLDVVPGAGHFLPHDAPEAFARAVNSL